MRLRDQAPMTKADPSPMLDAAQKRCRRVHLGSKLSAVAPLKIRYFSLGAKFLISECKPKQCEVRSGSIASL